MHYYGTRLSENISRREPEGYLLCLNVPVARTGVQEYLPEELGLPGFGAPGERASGSFSAKNGRQPREGPLGMISVYRPEEEVFSPETIASFEAMPVTNDHPPDGVDISNIRALQKGHVHNVRRGTGEESDLLLADLIITDPVLIDLILDGKREISCGYTYELCEENGQYIQRKIRGNHVAVVDAGRAGARVSIRDNKAPERRGRPCSSGRTRNKQIKLTFHQPSSVTGGGFETPLVPDGIPISETFKFERRTKTMKKSLSKILARMAKDGDIETVAEIIEEMIEPEGAEVPADTDEDVTETTAPVIEDPAAVVETPEGATIVVDESTLADIVSRLDRLIELLTPGPVYDDDPVEEIAEAVEEAIEAATAEEGEAVGMTGGTAGINPEDFGVTPEVLEPEDVAEIVEEILEPVSMEALSEVLDPLGDECEEEEEQEVLATSDALRVALKAVRPALAKMPKKQRARVCADIAARLRKPAGRRGMDAGMYAAIAAKKRRPYRGNPADLGKRIMASRNINCRR